MKKTIIINGKFLTQRQTGAQRYAREIVSELDGLCGGENIVIAVPPTSANIPKYKNIKVKRVGPFSGILWEQITLPLFTLYNCGKLLNLCNVAPLINPGISTIFDMKIWSFPQFYDWKFRLWYKILFYNQTSRCQIIFTDSFSAREDLLKYYSKLSPEVVVPAYGSWQHFQRIQYDGETLRKYGLLNNKYYFCMGSLEPNKNFKWVAEIAKRNSNAMFAVAGSLNNKIFANGLGFDCPENMKLLGYVSDEEAKTLMRDAKAFLFPSFCEGFGMPPLEAMSAGVYRVIVSDIPVMHEIFKENAIYINPVKYDYQLDELLEASKCDSDSVLERFSWADSAKIIYNRLKNK